MNARLPVVVEAAEFTASQANTFGVIVRMVLNQHGIPDEQRDARQRHQERSLNQLDDVSHIEMLGKPMASVNDGGCARIGTETANLAAAHMRP